MTKRASLTTKERRNMLESQAGACFACFCDIGPQPNGLVIPCIAEHWTPVAMGNTSKPDCLLCLPCADRKTNGTKATTYGSDSHAIAKVKRILRKAAGTWRPNRKKIAPRGFPERPEGYSTRWPLQSIPSRPWQKRGERNG